MKKSGSILTIFLIASLFLSISVVHAQPEHSESYCKVSNLNLNGQGDYLEIEPGGTIEISLDYEIWNRIGCPGCTRQIVIGLNREPLFCAYAGGPGTYPGVKGQKRFTITAPTELGTYVIRWMSASMYTCNDAKDKYRESDYLGYVGGTIKVTDSGNEYCQVSHIDLNGQGNYLEVKPGETIRMDATYKISDSNECPGCKQQIVIGLDNGVPLYCAYNGIPGVNNGIEDGVCEITAPTEPGTYNVMWMCTLEYTCHNAKNIYREQPSARKKIGTIKVTDCSGGICDNYCEVKSINLNGVDNYLEIEPGKIIRLTVYYELWSMKTCPECTHQIVIGLEDNPMYCAYDGTPGTHPGILDHDHVFYEMTAPTEPGIYNIMWSNTMGYTCDNAKSLYRNNPSVRKKIATIKVTDDGSEEWKLIHYKPVENIPYSDETIHSTILFYQRGNDLRIQINCINPDHPLIESGSTSISIDESIDINYSTGNVLGALSFDSDYEEIKPEMTLFHRSLLFSAGFLGGPIGIGLGIIQYAQDTADPNVCDWYEEDILAKDILVSPKNCFERYDVLNSRDNVIIPWYQGFPLNHANLIRVNCPKMTFPEANIYNIAFRVEYSIHSVYSKSLRKVRYDVALPITVT